MPFTPKDWKNEPLEDTPINEAALEDLETRVTDYTDQEVTAHAGLTTSAHGIADTQDIATSEYVDSEIDTLRNEPLTLGTIQTTASYTLVSTDNNKVVRMSSGSAQTLTVPDNIFVAGNSLMVAQVGAGTVTISAGSGVTLRCTESAPLTMNQYGIATLIFFAVDECWITGDIL